MSRRIGLLILVIFGAIIPLLIKDDYFLHVAIMIAVFSIAALGARLVMTTGQWTFAQGGFLTIGCYTSVLLRAYAGVPYWPAFLLAGLVAGAVGVLIGYPALRVKGVYFAIITLALNQLVRQVIMVTPDFTGGSQGFRGTISPPDPIPIPFLGQSLEFTGKVPFYYMALILLLIVLVVMYRMDRFPMGNIFKAIAQNDTLAGSVGINILRYRVLAFGMTCFFTGLAGSFFAHYYRMASPELFTLWHSVYVVAYAIVGGVNSIAGPVLGTFILMGSFEFLRATEIYQSVAYAIILLLVIRFLPGGLLSLGPLVMARLPRLQRVGKLLAFVLRSTKVKRW